MPSSRLHAAAVRGQRATEQHEHGAAVCRCDIRQSARQRRHRERHQSVHERRVHPFEPVVRRNVGEANARVGLDGRPDDVVCRIRQRKQRGCNRNDGEQCDQQRARQADSVLAIDHVQGDRNESRREERQHAADAVDVGIARAIRECASRYQRTNEQKQKCDYAVRMLRRHARDAHSEAEIDDRSDRERRAHEDIERLDHALAPRAVSSIMHCIPAC